MTIDKLFELIKKRKEEMPEGSYTSSLFKEGRDRIIQKIGEEAVEVIIEAKNNNKERVISEYADLLFHSLILLVELGIEPKEIIEELEKRDKSS